MNPIAKPSPAEFFAREIVNARTVLRKAMLIHDVRTFGRAFTERVAIHLQRLVSAQAFHGRN